MEVKGPASLPSVTPSSSHTWLHPSQQPGPGPLWETQRRRGEAIHLRIITSIALWDLFRFAFQNLAGSLFCGRVAFYCVHIYVPHFQPLFCWWTFRWLPCRGHCEQCCNEHQGACALLDGVFLWIYARSGIAESCGSSAFLFKEPPYRFPQWLHRFIFPLTVQEGSLLSTPPPAFIVRRFSDDGHSDHCEVRPHGSFDLCVSINQ